MAVNGEVDKEGFIAQWHSGEITNRLNLAKDMTLKALVQEGLLKREDAVSFAQNYAIVCNKVGWWGKLIDKFHHPNSKVGDGIMYGIVKLIPFEKIDLESADPKTIDEVKSSRFNLEE